MTARRTAAATVLAVAGVAACSSPLVLEDAPRAADPDCAHVIVALEGLDTLAGHPRVEVGTQSTAAWGEPAITLRCGMESPGPTTEGCVSVGGVDWVGPRDPSGGGLWITYGRVPAVELSVPPEAADDLDVVLGETSPAVAVLEQVRSCF